MGCNIVVTALLVAMVIYGGNCRAIDETIRLAEVESRKVLGPDSGLPSDAVKVESDMLFDTEEYKAMHRLDAEGQGGRKKRKAIRDESKRWTNKVVPYHIDVGFSESDKAQIEAAVEIWNNFTCLNLRPYRKGDDNYINIKDGHECSSMVGMQGGAQNVTLARGCRNKRIILHELGHAVGFYHEQTRPDGDQYVEILDNNIRAGMEHNFRHENTTLINHHNVQYDYLSIMHYGKHFFSKNGEITIRTADPIVQDIIGTQDTLSFRDVKLANLMYNCASHCESKTCSGYGYVGKDCKCYGPGVSREDFTLMTDFSQTDGTLKPFYQSEVTCLRYCATDSKCVAIDWNIVAWEEDNKRCWFHYEKNGACDRDTGRKSTNYRHYRYTKKPRCGGDGEGTDSGSVWGLFWKGLGYLVSS